MKRKLLSILLTLCLAFSLLPTAALADVIREDETGTGNDFWIAKTNEFRTASVEKTQGTYWANVVTAMPEGSYIQNEDNKTLTITSPEALAWFAKEVNGSENAEGKSFEGYKITIDADLDMSAHYWTPIDTATIRWTQNGSKETWTTVAPKNKLKNATITGGDVGHTITGLITATGLRGPAQPSNPGDGQNCYYYSAFIGRNDAELTIQNLVFKDSRIAMTEPAEGVGQNATSMCAVLVGINSGALTIDSVKITNAQVLAMQKAAVLVGMSTKDTNASLTLNDCIVEGCAVHAYFQTALLCAVLYHGFTANNIKLKDNTVTMFYQATPWAYETVDGSVYASNESIGYPKELTASDAINLVNETFNGKHGVNCIAEVNGYQYISLADAIAAAHDGDTVTLLKDTDITTANTCVPSNVSIILDLNGKTIKAANTVAGSIEVLGTLTLKDNTDVVKNGTGSGRIYTESKYVAKTGDATLIRVRGGAKFVMESGLIDAASFTNNHGSEGQFGIGFDNKEAAETATIEINGGHIKAGWYAIAGNGKSVSADGDIIVNGGVLESVADYALYLPHRGTATINGGVIYGKAGGIAINRGNLVITDGTITSKGTGDTGNWGDGTGNLAAAAINVNAKYGVSTVEISGGEFCAEQNALFIENNTTYQGKIAVTGGLFSSDVTKYCAEGLMAVANEDSTTKSTYPYTIGEVPDAAIDMTITEHTQAGATDGSVSESVTDKTAAEAVASSVTADETGLENAAGTVTVTDTEKKTAIQQLLADGQITLDNDGNVAPPQGETEVTVTIIKQPYLDVEVTALNSAAKELSLTIEPKYNLLATTNKDDDSKSVVVSTGNALTVTDEMEVRLALPTGFANADDKLSIKHEKDNGTVEYYTGTVSVENGNLYVTFTTKGFSPFTISAPAASIGETMYPTLAEAIAKAANGDIVKLEKDCTESVTVSGKSLTIDKNNHEYDFAKVTVDANSTKTENGGTLTITYTAPSSSSGSSGYYVSTPSKTENGTVTVSPRYADKGDTVTVTVKPDSGYVLDDLTVTDKNGNKLTLTDKGNGKYTFTMPSGRVEVKASFTKEAETSPFADVATDAYYYEAVKWAVKNGITTGVGDNLFAPGQPCTRAQIVTFLWRAAGSPEPKGTAAGMTDVVTGSYYEKAVAWAIENGVTTGTTATTFSPDATCTRAQAVTFLARALNAKAASAAEFSDVPTDSYFADAVAWAAANGVTEGVGNGLFAPDNDCTRGQIVTFLYRAYNK